MTFVDMQNKIADDITRDDLIPQIKTAINEAIRTWEGFRTSFNEKIYRINTIPGQEYYDLMAPTLLETNGDPVPTGETVLELDSITIIVSQLPYRLTPRTQQWMDDWQTLPSQYLGQPDSYTIFRDQLRLFPIPDTAGPGVDGAYQLTLSCLARLGPSPLVEDGDSNAWMTEGESLIRYQAEHSLLRFPLRDVEGMQLAKDGIAAAQFELNRKMAAKAFTGTQAPWSL